MAVPLKRKHKRKINFSLLDKEIKHALKLVLDGFFVDGVDLKDIKTLFCVKNKVLIKIFPNVARNAKKFKLFLYVLQRMFNIHLHLCHYYEIDVKYREVCWGDKENRGKVATYCFPLDNGNCIIRKKQKEHFPKTFLITAKSLLLE